MARRRELPFAPDRPEDGWHGLWDGEATAIASLMATPPHGEPRSSQEELLPLREVLVDAIDALPERHRFAFDACVIERRPMRDTAKELGCTKSTVHRLKDEAVLLLRAALTDHPAIKTYLTGGP